MHAEGEMERLDRLGQDAAQKARLTHQALANGSGAGLAAVGSHRIPVVGRLLVPVLLILMISLGLAIYGIAQPVPYAMGLTIALEGFYFLYKRRRTARLKATGQDLQTQLHALKQKEFALRYEAAKQDGTLDRFKEPS